MVSVHFLLKAIGFLVLVQKLYLKNLLNFILTDESFAKALKGLKTGVLVNKSLCGKLFSSLESPPTIFDENLKVTSVHFFIPNSYL